ncbi:hypothetical protein [Bordetella sp. 02P26C-1]|uniref:hypothetical protein n=1 Tax=Bordetella sp. 02P26C-1 TaxID=2683195 RepID=UPI0013558998|nr:hypothetical protein [Bordetella sp. 02P26C-1]MVW79837.1 hypothetical protein [Bordetella sp. 02P26C-1]
MSDRIATHFAHADLGVGHELSPRTDHFLSEIETIFHTLGRATLDLQAIVTGMSTAREADVDIPANR